jgi:hypothetical protein
LTSLREPHLLSGAAFAAVFGLLSWAAAGSARALVRVYGPLGAGLAVSYGVGAIARGGALREGATEAAVTVLGMAGIIGVLELAEWRLWRAKPTAAGVEHRDQQPNDR